MVEPTTIVSSVFAALNTIVRGISYTAHFAEVREEVKQLQINIEITDRSIKTANRLIDTRSHYLDPHLVQEAKDNVRATKEVLDLVCSSIESCRKDLALNNSVSAPTRAAWVAWRSERFRSKLQTLMMCCNALNRDIQRMEAASPPSGPPPSYGDNGYLGAGAPDRLAVGNNTHKPSFSRSPSRRMRDDGGMPSAVNVPHGSSIVDVARLNRGEPYKHEKKEQEEMSPQLLDSRAIYPEVTTRGRFPSWPLDLHHPQVTPSVMFSEDPEVSANYVHQPWNTPGSTRTLEDTDSEWALGQRRSRMTLAQSGIHEPKVATVWGISAVEKVADMSRGKSLNVGDPDMIQRRRRLKSQGRSELI